ncbi:MAG: zinc ABC transporter substrate-binding protein [Spirochaetia bacterium]|nr:zinc ABC transporter substrate-binding protein [Spirochaetia bacterium]MCF7940099.1 zinc ABC transporter substrate-binding protein [Spirochaetia bacterium]
MKTHTIILMLLILVLPLTSCTREPEQISHDDRITVAVSILPQKTFVQKIAGDRAEVIVLVPPGQSPSTYEPTTRQLQELSRSTVYFSIGVPFEEAFMPVIERNLPDLKIVATDATTEKRRFLTTHIDDIDDDHADDDHADEEAEDDHDHSGIDPHIWMSPIAVIEQSRIMTEALIEADPRHEKDYRDGFTAYEQELRALDEELAQALAPIRGATILVYHPAFGYFADRYGLIQKAVEVGGKEPTPREIESLIAMAKSDEVPIVFVQPEFNKKTAQVIADAIGAKVITIASLDEQYSENLRHIAQVLNEQP